MSKNRVLTILKDFPYPLFMGLAFLLALYLLYQWNQRDQREKKTQPFDRVAGYLLERLDHRSILGQIFLLYLPLEDTKAIFHVRPGTLFIQKRSIPQKNGQQDHYALKKRLAEMRQTFRERGIPPPFIAVDQEFGRVQRIKNDVHEFPAAMAMGHAVRSGADPKNIYWVGFHSCVDLKKLHINWPLAPVADLHDDPENPVIGTRSFGSDPELVSEILLHYVQGLHDAGCMDALKHFPGHGGTSSDSHKELPVVDKTLRQLERKELIPFRALAQSSSAIMLGHLLLPQVDREITTFSPRWVDRYLKEEMNFKGLIMTDDLGMRAVTPDMDQKNITRSVSKAIAGGADVLLLADGAARFAPYVFDLLLKKMKQPEFRKRVFNSAKKMLIQKLKYGLYWRLLQKELKGKKIEQKKHLREAMLSVLEGNDAREERRKFLEKKAPDPALINQTLSRGGIKYLSGRPRKIVPEKNRLFTNVSSKDLPCLRRFKKVHFSFDALMTSPPKDQQSVPDPESPMEMVILYESSKLSGRMKRFLRWKERPGITFLTTANPFPHSGLGSFFRKNDRLIVSFSNSSGSKKALREFLCSEIK